MSVCVRVVVLRNVLLCILRLGIMSVVNPSVSFIYVDDYLYQLQFWVWSPSAASFPCPSRWLL